MTRRELISLSALPLLSQERVLPTAPVSIRKCLSYNEDFFEIFGQMFDEIGGLPKLVRHKTVTIKLNLTGSPGLRYQGKALGVTHYSHPKHVMAMTALLDRAGAKRIRFVESAWGTAGPLAEYLLDSGWPVRQMASAGKNVEFLNTNALGGFAKRYVRMKVPHGGWIFPSFEFNEIYAQTDVMMSMAKLKNHDTCGVTLAMKNLFGCTPASIYGNDSGVDDPNEAPTSGRNEICHDGKRQPSKIAAGELNPTSPRESTYRMPRIAVEVVAARPIDIAFLDGIETMTGGEGPWIDPRHGTFQGLGLAKPGLLVLGTNPVTTDTVGTALMGYDPRAVKGKAPFHRCDNMLLLAEEAGIGTANLKKIEVIGGKIEDLRFKFPMSL
ncbi:DUF362 domain-containing protein [Bryobacter aggregatus]|uniref:DUF362 domain-containing protein n=1 Tax=Bryobacter aggregatus TaxID=360054 RepID=UPI0004E2837B|nr:DUF362 domain-containing protein [Bryobacter aggregatus]